MAQIFEVPDLGEGVDSVDVVSVLVEVGDHIEVGQPIMEVETDKASVEVPSTIAGVVEELHISEGDSLATGSPVLSVADSQATVAEEKAPPPDKALDTPPTTAPPQRSTVEADPEVPESASTSTAPPVEPRTSRGTTSKQAGALVPAAPAVRRFAREVGVDLTQVTGSGPEGRLTLDDVKAHAQHLLAGSKTSSAHVASPTLPDFTRWGEVTEEPMTKVRRLTAERMDRAWRSVPQVTHNDTADVTDLERLRQRFKKEVEEAGGKLTVTAILVKIIASTLKRFPNFNSSLDMERQLVLRKSFFNVGVAVDTPRGLLVPVIKDAASKNIKTLAVELQDLATRARDRKLLPDELQGATFSISNLGGIGGTGFSPIVNWPEVAILGVSRSRQEPIWNGESFQPKTMLPLSLTYDHRLIDGAEAARFMRSVAQALEEPMMLVLEG